MEHLVKEALDDYLKKVDKNVCVCERCKLDMMAFILNKLPPHYVVSEKGYIYNKISEMKLQLNVDLLKYIIEAIEVVSKNVRH